MLNAESWLAIDTGRLRSDRAARRRDGEPARDRRSPRALVPHDTAQPHARLARHPQAACCVMRRRCCASPATARCPSGRSRSRRRHGAAVRRPHRRRRAAARARAPRCELDRQHRRRSSATCSRLSSFLEATQGRVQAAVETPASACACWARATGAGPLRHAAARPAHRLDRRGCAALRDDLRRCRSEAGAGRVVRGTADAVAAASGARVARGGADDGDRAVARRAAPARRRSTSTGRRARRASVLRARSCDVATTRSGRKCSRRCSTAP